MTTLLDHLALSMPGRVLADIAAKRAILARFTASYNGFDEYGWVLVDLATAFGDHPDYRPGLEWDRLV